MGVQAKIRAERRQWKPVPNAKVVACARPDCRKCRGRGVRYTFWRRRPYVCKCAVRTFWLTNMGRLRMGKGRAGLEVRVDA